MQSCPRLLITDDDHAMRESLGDLFQDRGLETLFASDGKEACELVQTQQVHLVIIDFHMPRMTGLEALKNIKLTHQRMPVILMSAQLDEQLVNEIEQADAFSIHSKPLDIARMRHDVSAALQEFYNWSKTG